MDGVLVADGGEMERGAAGETERYPPVQPVVQSSAPSKSIVAVGLKDEAQQVEMVDMPTLVRDLAGSSD